MAEAPLLAGRDERLHEFPQVVGEELSNHRDTLAFLPQGLIPEVREDDSL
jgi:hypothetical protein